MRKIIECRFKGNKGVGRTVNISYDFGSQHNLRILNEFNSKSIVFSK